MPKHWLIQAHCLTVCGDVYGRCLAVLGEISNKQPGIRKTWYSIGFR